MVVVALALPAVGLLSLPLSVVLLVRVPWVLVPALFLLGLCFVGLLVLFLCLLLGLTPVVNLA